MKHFEEVLKALGAQTSNLLLESKHWNFWEAEYATPIKKIKGYYLYLKASCPLSEASAKNLSDFSALSIGGEYQVIVTPRSDLAKDLSATKIKFRAIYASTTSQLLQENLLRDVQYKPLDREEYFISPSISLESGTVEIDGLGFLCKWLVGETNDFKNSPIALLAANGGNGKTTLARELCEGIRKKYPRVLPLLIESGQWKNIANTGFSLDILWDIAISRRLDNCNQLRSNQSALRVLMQEGLLVIIFDGFDELASTSGDSNRPNEIILELQNLFTPEDEDVRAKVILTSRTTYWKSIESVLENGNQIPVFNLNGFNNEQRKAYFESRLQNPAERDTAIRLAKQISGPLIGNNSNGMIIEDSNKDRLSGTPFVLALIAHYVEENDSEEINPYGTDPLEPLLIGVCRRENNRQTLNIAPETQLNIFEEIFRMCDDAINQKDLDLILQMYEITDANIRKSFLNHFFLHTVSPDHLGARFEVLKIYFIAKFLAKGLQKYYATTPEQEIAKSLSLHFLGQSQVIEWLVWQLKKIPKDKILLAIKHALEIINSPENHVSRHKASIAISKVIGHLIEGDEKKERAISYKEMLFSKSENDLTIIENHVISGSLKSIDFSKTIFQNCVLVDVDFHACKFDEFTKFVSCRFEGILDFTNCDGVTNIQRTDCSLSPDSEVVWSKFSSTKPSHRVQMEFAEEALVKALKKFKGDFGFHGIQYRRRNGSTNPRNPHNIKIWEVLKHRNVVEQHSITGVTEGGLHIRDDKDLRREISQYLDNGIIGPTLKSVLTDLIDE